ncbi:MAG: manganese efflux pump MntP family protein [Bacteroidales bacterium]|nr:manganese efflux pump MntP family protein [Bacteroidales bacterium]
MEFLTVLIIAVGLSFDSFAVSLGCGAAESEISFKRALKVAVILALFQGLFPVVGFYMGYFILDYVEHLDHWIAFGLLSFLGVRMILEGAKNGIDGEKKDLLNNATIVTMGISTSIDAMAVGISFAFLFDQIWFEALVIGVITFIASMIAIKIGKYAGPRLGSRVEISGGILLIAIGLKILLEHTVLA